MAITSRTATAAQVASGSTLTGVLPTGLSDTDVLISIAAVSDATTGITWTTTGWTQLFTPFVPSGSGSPTFAGYYQVVTNAGSVTPVSASWTGGAGRATILTQAYIGVDNTTPLDTTIVTATPTSAPRTSIVVPSVTTATANARLISGVAADSSAGTDTITVPATMTRVTGNDATALGRSCVLADETFVTAGATGTRTWTHSDLAISGFMTALRPATANPQNYTQTPTDALGLTDVAAPALTSPWSFTYSLRVG